MIDTQADRIDLTSFNQLVQELIAGAIRRHTFTSWELDLLLDLQESRIRKSARADILRRYLKAVQQQFSCDAPGPLRLSAFLEGEQRYGAPPRSAPPPRTMPARYGT